MKIKTAPPAPFTHLSLPRQSPAGGVGLCSQSHWKVGEGEESSWEVPRAGHLEMVPGRKKEAARVGGIMQEWRKARFRSNRGAGQPGAQAGSSAPPLWRLVCDLGGGEEGTKRRNLRLTSPALVRSNSHQRNTDKLF